MPWLVICRGVAQPGSAFGSGPKGRRFESSRPDFNNIKSYNRLTANGALLLRGAPFYAVSFTCPRDSLKSARNVNISDRVALTTDSTRSSRTSKSLKRSFISWRVAAISAKALSQIGLVSCARSSTLCSNESSRASIASKRANTLSSNERASGCSCVVSSLISYCPSY